jgi:hypothetical protein
MSASLDATRTFMELHKAGVHGQEADLHAAEREGVDARELVIQVPIARCDPWCCAGRDGYGTAEEPEDEMIIIDGTRLLCMSRTKIRTTGTRHPRGGLDQTGQVSRRQAASQNIHS